GRSRPHLRTARGRRLWRPHGRPHHDRHHAPDRVGRPGRPHRRTRRRAHSGERDRRGRTMKVAVIDSGVHAAHPHINGVAGGVAFTADGHEEADYTDRLGHGTAVTAVIRERAPGADIFAVKIFYDRLATRMQPLIAALDWCVQNGVQVVNLSLGTNNPAHEPALRAAVGRLQGGGVLLVAAHEWL